MGDVYTYSYPRVFGADVPFPSWGDAIYLSLYPALFGGIFILARRRNPSGEWASLIDSLILTIGLGLISWLVLISPVIHDDSQTQLARIVSVAYPTADILLLAGALRLAVDNGKRQPAFYLLFGSITTLLVTDFIYGVMLNNGTYNGQVLLDIGWISYYLLWGTSALHPSMRTLEEPVPEKETSLSWQRLGVLTVASLIAPGLQVLLGGQRCRRGRAGHDRRLDRPVPAGRGAHGGAGRAAGALGGTRTRAAGGGHGPGRRGRPGRHRRRRAVGHAHAGRCRLLGASVPADRRAAGADRLALTGGTLLSRGTTQRLLLAASIPTATDCREEVYNELLFSERPRTAHVLSLEVRDEPAACCWPPARRPVGQPARRAAVARDQRLAGARGRRADGGSAPP